jgi:SpoIID/LytB domain protein
MTENDTDSVIVYSPAGVSAPGVTDAKAVYFDKATAPKWSVWAGTSCAGPWTPVSTGQATPVATPVAVSEPLQICVSGGNTTVDGSVGAVYNSLGQARTVNTLPLEQYVADTVPGESPSYWATMGGLGPQGHDWGFQELEAQAVAVRSYVLAHPGGYGGYADTCDLECQTYRGTEYQTPDSVAAATDTAGEVMFMPDGSIADTEYSASTGGYTSSAAQTSPFTPVPDAGDAIGTNPNHSWTAQVAVSAIDAQWPAIGTFTGVTDVVGDGFEGTGETFSRVDTLTVVGTAGRVAVTGPEFADDLGLKSDWFSFTSVATGEAGFTGHGWGHGIGMGQWGALGYAVGQDGGQGNWTWQQIVDHFYGPATLGNLSGPPAPVDASGGVGGYWLSAADGGIFAFGNAGYYGSMGGRPLNQPIVGMAATADAGGYWEDATDGGIFAFGDARFYGSMGGRPLNEPMVGMAATPTGGGYWLVASDGGIFSFGAARFYGSMGGRPLNRPIVGMASTPDGHGYWLVASDGGIFSFGDAPFFGSTGSLALDAPIVGMAPTPDGAGYWLVGADGGVFTFGDARFEGSAAGTAAGDPAVTLLPTRTGDGYLVAGNHGTVAAFGDAPALGDLTTAVRTYGGTLVGGATSAA